MQTHFIDEIVRQVRTTENEGKVYEPEVCVDIAVYLQETTNLITAIEKSVEQCKRWIGERNLDHSCSKPLDCLKPDIVVCRVLESALKDGFESQKYQALIENHLVKEFIGRASFTTDLIALSEIYPLSQLQDPSLLLDENRWNAFISDERTKNEASDILSLYIAMILEGTVGPDIEITPYVMRWLQKRPTGTFKIEYNLDIHPMFMLLLRRVYFSLFYFSGDDQYRDLIGKIGGNEPSIPGGMEQCSAWLRRVARRVSQSSDRGRSHEMDSEYIDGFLAGILQL